MPRSNSSVPRHRRHRKIVKLAKGYRGARNSNFKTAKDAVEKGMLYAYRDRRQNKRNFRKLWIMRINAAVRQSGFTYSQFISLIKKNNIALNRKSLAYMAVNDPDGFDIIVKSISK
tara:strand:+ start:2238 stop:2585 length:348 start_codon:yes stop_codon:yes gene_type:complete